MKKWMGAALLAAAFAPSCGSLETHEDVSYDTRFGDATTMDIYVPDGDGRHAGVMFVHGGAWEGGSKSEYTQAAQRLARSGWVTSTINYRLVPDGVYPRMMQDCVCALSFLRTHASDYHLDPDRIAVMGYSAGGHLVSLLGVATEDPLHVPDCAWGATKPPRAVISGAGWHDFRGQDAKLFRDVVGGDESAIPDKWIDISPITHVRPGLPPFLFVNGTQDVFVHLHQARTMRDALVAQGNQAEVLELAGGGHLLNRTTDLGEVALEEEDLTPEAWIAVADFLERTMGKP
jgi:acetyl esterase/lipase